MIKSKKKILLILLTVLSIISIGANSYSHSGRTDSSGGHNDNKNKRFHLKMEKSIIAI